MQMPGQTSSTLLRGASVNPSKTRFSLRNTSHAFANELLPGWTHCLFLQAGFQVGMRDVNRHRLRTRNLHFRTPSWEGRAPKNGIWIPLLIPISGDVYSTNRRDSQSQHQLERRLTRRGEGRAERFPEVRRGGRERRRCPGRDSHRCGPWKKNAWSPAACHWTRKHVH